MPEDKDIELRSEEVQEILTRVPNWMIRWGTIVVSGVILMMFFSMWFIKYPDIILTQIVITTNIPPEKVVAKVSGKIEAILVQDKSIVEENTPLAIIQNTANYKDVFLLKGLITEYSKDADFDFKLLENAQLGDIESTYALFHSTYIANELNANLQPFRVEGKAQNLENIQISERLTILQEQKSLNESELQLQKNEVNRYEMLFDKGVISAQDFENKKLGYLQAEKNYRSLLSTISQLKSNLIDNSKNSKSTKITATKEEVNLESNKNQAFYQLKKVIKDWELSYVLQSSVIGKVSFLQIWTKNQTIVAGDNVFSVIPTLEKGYIGKLKASALNSGKILVGQDVNIRLTNFPDSQYGMLNGKIKNISLTPDASDNLLIDVALPKKLETSYHKIVPFQQEMSGSAEIVTEDLRLIERLLYQFRDIFRR
ncbi:HlyD family secretion protein [Flavobacterium gawalongense]|uniref:HlyD family efflux transporter periplasmic adaptor subunit n=1 Tax=Flavobacterium gawalongense TaxID=2594432 RepID=A0A553BJZ7_9FLAO|nr:HlyD family efflux transporter periplasmic adaptor subunit [Flavobacterium gawalongense]TRX08576.1 HlyD family efflux transporter periplasmic adaptor subunit [Flavobacterium gawalongense]TRX09559.1 HlyD family efflux transporter periplasmic adaptor subunit [Flavobacterium gawalongense]TRX25568.1 HlyD family efflux transporter periplasmic adaptor subunit [Flavobacterium gawalongense]